MLPAPAASITCCAPASTASATKAPIRHICAPRRALRSGLDRPSGPSSDLAVALLREAGVQPQIEHLTVASGQPERSLLVAFMRRRLCLPASRDDEVDEALGPHWNTERRTVTLWWDA